MINTSEAMAAERSEPGARVYGTPGERSRQAGLLRLTWPIACALWLAGYLWRAAWPWPVFGPVWAGWGLLGLGLALMLVISLRYRRAGAFFVGARGEQEVARLLAQLPSGFVVFHAVRLPGAAAGPASDLDHVVLGPCGIWVIETKSWSGRVTLEAGRLRYNGRLPDRSPIGQAREGAATLARALRTRLGGIFQVHALVCFAGNRFVSGEGSEAGVQVCNADRLYDFLRRPHAGAPGPEALEGIARAMRDWLPAE